MIKQQSYLLRLLRNLFRCKKIQDLKGKKERDYLSIISSFLIISHPFLVIHRQNPESTMLPFIPNLEPVFR
jgi:hypothetical protein